MNSRDGLANTWKFVPDAPITVAGYPLTCPGCGSAEGIRFWVYPNAPTVKAEHTCVPFSAPTGPRLWTETAHGRSKIRRWDEPRVTQEFVRRHGVSLLSEFNTHLGPRIEEIRKQFRNRRTGRGER